MKPEPETPRPYPFITVVLSYAGLATLVAIAMHFALLSSSGHDANATRRVPSPVVTSVPLR